MGECFFWYRPTWVVPDKASLNVCMCAYCVLGPRPRSSRRGEAAEQLGFVVSESGQIRRGETVNVSLHGQYLFNVQSLPLIESHVKFPVSYVAAIILRAHITISIDAAD